MDGKAGATDAAKESKEERRARKALKRAEKEARANGAAEPGASKTSKEPRGASDDVASPVAESSEAGKKRKRKDKAAEVGADVVHVTATGAAGDQEAGETGKKAKKEKKEKKRSEADRGTMAEPSNEAESSAAPASTKRKRVEFAAGTAGTDGAAATEVAAAAASAKAPKRAKKPKGMKPSEMAAARAADEAPAASASEASGESQPDGAADKSDALSEQAQRGIKYARAFARKDGWKFNKARQNWLMRNAWTDEIPDTHVDLVVAYLQTIQGASRAALLSVAERYRAGQHVDEPADGTAAGAAETAAPVDVPDGAAGEGKATDAQALPAASALDTEAARLKEMRKARAERLLAAMA